MISYEIYSPNNEILRVESTETYILKTHYCPYEIEDEEGKKRFNIDSMQYELVGID